MRRLVLLFMTPFIIEAQNLEPAAPGSAEEMYLEQASEGEDPRLRAEELEELRRHPVDVVRPSYGELLRIPFISPLLAESIILFTDTVTVQTVEQLRGAALMSPALFDQIAPYITADSRSSGMGWGMLLPQSVEIRSRYEQRLQTTEGFLRRSYHGEPYSTYQRFRAESSILELAGMVEKDPGELFRDRFVARYAELKLTGINSKMVIGNFSVASGQGLLFARPMSAAKGSDAAGQIRKRGSQINPSVSADEFRFFDGAALQSSIGGIDVTALFSHRSLPASVDSSGTVTSFYTSGLYRNRSELGRRYNVEERLFAGIFRFSVTEQMSFTVSGMNVSYGRNLESSLFHSQGRRSLSAGSISAEAAVGKVRFFGEAASDDAAAFAAVGGFILPLSRSLAVSFLHRSYPVGYSAPFARPFGERSDIGDGESGEYLGMELRHGATTIAAYADIFRFPVSESHFSSRGSEYFAQLTHRFTDRSELQLHSRRTLRLQEDEVDKTSYRLGHTYRISRKVTIGQRFESVGYRSLVNGTKENGLLTSVEAHLREWKGWLSVRARLTWFRSSSYDARLYHYEPDVPGNISNPPLYGDGFRWFILIHSAPFDYCTIALKYAEMKKLHEPSLGSGDDRIAGNLDSRIALQIDFRW